MSLLNFFEAKILVILHVWSDFEVLTLTVEGLTTVDDDQLELLKFDLRHLYYSYGYFCQFT